MPRIHDSLLAVCCAVWLLATMGCHVHDPDHHARAHDHLDKLLHPHRNAGYLENPLFVPECDREFVWQQLVDALATHFKIQREERMRVIGEVITGGEITTYPTSAATLAEPWRGNSVGFASRLTSTLQSQQKFARLQLTPTTGGYQVALQVHVQQEDLDRPERSTVGGASIRHDGTITRIDQTIDARPVRLGWIDVGRDTLLEQRILADIRDRLAVAWR